jgi:phosphoribosylformylglycinamidine synthase
MHALHAAIRDGLVASAHDLSEGGLAVAAAEMAFAGGLGLELELDHIPTEALPAGYDPTATRLYSESCTRWLVEVAPEDAEAFEARLGPCSHARVGRVTGSGRLELTAGGAGVLSLPLAELRAAHRSGFEGGFHEREEARP